MTASHPLLRSKAKERNRVFLILLLILLLGGGFSLLLLDSTGFGYYRYVDEVMNQPENFKNKQLQIHGFVVPGSLHQIPDPQRQTMRHEFTMENCGKIIAVQHFGVVPDTFREQAEVVVKGKLQLTPFTALLQATEISTKCPSKYSQDKEQERARAARCLHE